MYLLYYRVKKAPTKVCQKIESAHYEDVKKYESSEYEIMEVIKEGIHTSGSPAYASSSIIEQTEI